MIDLAPIMESAALRNNFGDIELEMLGHGEYNVNYTFQAARERLVLRVPMGSQMYLDNQVRYEYEALRLLEPSGRTPKPLYIDDDLGFLVMSFLPGQALKYETDLASAALCLADIHNLNIPENTHLLAPKNPLAAVLEECFAMSGHYMDSPLGLRDVKGMIAELLERGRVILDGSKVGGRRCLINTELNSGNFLVNHDKTFLVDWEKPLYAYAQQDLGHFLAPTTTLWKTDSVLTMPDIQGFLESYCAASKWHKDPEQMWEDTKPFFVMNCLRGVTWCSMAWLEYQSPDRALKDTFTFEKIKSYLKPEFLENIGGYFDA
ncbi:MAG: phosphotransferase [Defluviitaleaceae bacterium]|nr:phosphotransferase [Defluviitaleaceae bacterium]